MGKVLLFDPLQRAVEKKIRCPQCCEKNYKAGDLVDAMTVTMLCLTCESSFTVSFTDPERDHRPPRKKYTEEGRKAFEDLLKP